MPSENINKYEKLYNINIEYLPTLNFTVLVDICNMTWEQFKG